MASTMDKIKAKVDNVLHKDSTQTDPTGPHDSHAANKADPRVDSDRVGPSGNTSGAGVIGGGQYTEGHHHTGGHHTTGGLTGTTGTTGTTGYSDPTGPHDSRLANKADPRVDSDRVGPAGNTAGAGYGHNTTTGGGLTGHSATGGYDGTTGSDPTGPHDSRLANKLDPRVDSDRVGPAGNTGSAGYGNSTTTGGGLTGHSTTGGGLTGHSTTGGGLTGHSTTGGYGTSGSDPTGPHDSRLANKADPRVDSDRIGTQGNVTGAGHHTGGHHHGHHHGTVGTGAAPNTAGPHNSDLLNKADPRVDSDLDGSKTYGGDKTYQ